jgi:peptidoglycan/xylan/chitin deacetylase (PgdA/CDA1 family)
VKRVISFCFDDGFRRSARTICDVFSRRGVAACFAILAQPERALDPYVRGADLGDWDFWRTVRAAGHEVAPHGLIHERYSELSLEEVQRSVLSALQIMEAELPGFRRGDSMFHVPYLSAPDEVVQWLGTQSLGVRLELEGRGVNLWPDLRLGGPIDSICFGPDEVAASARARIRDFVTQDGWLVVVMHGVDGEGWGPIARRDLDSLLDAATTIGAAVIPPNQLLASLASRRRADR